MWHTAGCDKCSKLFIIIAVGNYQLKETIERMVTRRGVEELVDVENRSHSSIMKLLQKYWNWTDRCFFVVKMFNVRLVISSHISCHMSSSSL